MTTLATVKTIRGLVGSSWLSAHVTLDTSDLSFSMVSEGERSERKELALYSHQGGRLVPVEQYQAWEQ